MAEPTTTVEQFLKALAVVESKDDPEAWGDAGRAMGRWQVHLSKLWVYATAYYLSPGIEETLDQFVASILRCMFVDYSNTLSPVEIAMLWHVRYLVKAGGKDWDLKYEARFNAALINAREELP